MTKDNMLKLPMGTPVTFFSQLRRDWRGEKYDQAYWYSAPYPETMQGVYIGYRWLPEGRVSRNEYNRHDWHAAGPGKGVLAALVAYHPRKKPVYVAPDELYLRDD